VHTLLFNALVCLLDLLGATAIARRPLARTVLLVALVEGCTASALATLVALSSDLRFFGLLTLLSWLLFAHLPLMLLVAAGLVRRGAPAAARTLSLAALGLFLLAGYCFGLEPRRLVVSEHTLVSPKVSRPITVGVLADLQTDRIGPYEARVVETLLEHAPDLILLPGDYLQVRTRTALEEQGDALRALLLDSGLSAPLGVFAVRGDVEPPSWPDHFRGLEGYEAVTTSRTFELEGLTLTALDPAASRSQTPPVPASDQFHVVFGHDPAFALAAPPADLLLAGHTHGGQVQFPFFGPLITLSKVPRTWAAGGLVRLPSGSHLIVSRGVGMERKHAPRLRFNCPPELVLVHLEPGG